jgi:hypothetical protein
METLAAVILLFIGLVAMGLLAGLTPPTTRRLVFFAALFAFLAGILVAHWI